MISLSGKLPGRISIFEGVIGARDWYKGRHEQLLPELGSSIRQQFRDVCRTGGRLGGTFDGWLDAQRAGQGPDTRPQGRRDSPTNAGVGAQSSGGSGAEESRSKSAGVSGLWAPADTPDPRSGTHLSDPFRAGDNPTAAGLVPALPDLAISRGSCLGLERGRQRLACGARDGGTGRQQNAVGRSQCGHRAADRGQTAACHLGSGGASPRPTGGAEACPTGRTNAPEPRG